MFIFLPCLRFFFNDVTIIVTTNQLCQDSDLDSNEKASPSKKGKALKMTILNLHGDRTLYVCRVLSFPLNVK